MKGTVYILQSKVNGRYYVGSTSNLTTRLYFHNSGQVKATKLSRPYEVVFSQEFFDTATAKKVETKIKSWKRRDYLERIIKDGFIKFAGL